MESSSEGRCGEIASDLSIIFVTVVQLIFFACFHEYIAWYTRQPDGIMARLPLLTDDYFSWLPYPVVASTLVVVATLVMVFWTNEWFRQIAWIGFCILGIVVVVSLLVIFPLDFSLIPNATAAAVVPVAVRVFFVLLAVFYGVSALVMLVRWRRPTGRQETE